MGVVPTTQIGNGHLVTQIGLEDRDGHASEERSPVSIDTEVEKLKISRIRRPTPSTPL